MIQRIQSVWLLVASAMAFLTLKVSFYSGTFLTDNQYHQLNGTDNILLMTTTIAVGIVALMAIFLYKTRVIQLRLCIIGILLDLLLLFLYLKAKQNFTQGEYAITAALHLVIQLSLAFAARGIRKDDKLIKDSDRLR
jgi:hypothetical protein